MSKIILVTGSIVGYAYGMEFFIAYYGGNPYELYAFKNRAFGDYLGQPRARRSYIQTSTMSLKAPT